MAACFLLIFAIGIYMADLPRTASHRLFLYDTHKSFGMLVLGLLFIRIVLLLRVLLHQRKPSGQQRFWLKTTMLHTLLYGFMLIVPLTGYLYSSTAGSHVPFFGLQIPLLFPENANKIDVARNTHFWFAYSFLILIVLHVLVQRKFLKTVGQRIAKRFKRDIAKH
ncbi:MAG: hypothetical protein Kow00121_39160 [Elainellaceae cyanobacterium]